jgi:hypothetical protein
MLLVGGAELAEGVEFVEKRRMGVVDKCRGTEPGRLSPS